MYAFLYSAFISIAEKPLPIELLAVVAAAKWMQLSGILLSMLKTVSQNTSPCLAVTFWPLLNFKLSANF